VDLDFKFIKKKTNGMLPVAAYEKIYNYAKKNRGNIVEIGTAHGAATICLASAIDEKSGHVYTFEKIVGGSREKYGSIDENLRIIKSNYEQFKVDKKISQYIGDVVVEANNIKDISTFSMLMMDADGRLDRDFVLFYDRLKPGGIIVIDDCDDRIKVKFKSNIMLVDQKHRLTHLFINKFEQLGFLERIEIVGNTYFGHKPETNPKSINELSILDTSAIYSNLVFSHIDYMGMIKTRTKYYLSRLKSKILGLFK